MTVARVWAAAQVTALGLLLGGCMAPAPQGDAALIEVQRLRAEAAQRDGVIAVLREKQESLSQQLGMAMAVSTAALDPKRDAEISRQLGEISERLGRIDVAFTQWRKQEEPSEVDLAAARRAAEQGTEEERAAAVRKVQALLDAGQVKVTVKDGKAQLSLLRPLDAKDPYKGPAPATADAGKAPAPKPAAPKPPPGKISPDLLLDRR